MRKQQLQIDGIPVDLSKARFSNTFDVAEGDERSLAVDEDVVYVIVANVASARFASGKGGDQVRINALKVKEARLIKNDEYKQKVLAQLGFDEKPAPSMLEEEKVEDAAVPVVARLIEEPYGNITEFTETEQTLLEDAGLVESDDESEELEAELQAYLAKMKEIGDAYDGPDIEQLDELLPGQSRVVGEAKGMAEDDPVLRNFLAQ